MRMLLTGDLAPAIHARLDLPGLETIVASGPPTQADLDAVEAWCGTAPVDGLDLGGLEWVHAPAAGPDAFTRAIRTATSAPGRGAAGARHDGPLLTRTVGGMPQRAAAHALAAWLPEALGFDAYARDQAAHHWGAGERVDVTETCIAVLGTGSLGVGMARAIRALGARVIGCNTNGRPVDGFDRTHALGSVGHVPADTAAALAEVDAVVSTLPGTDDTAGIIGDALLGALKGAYLVNVGRGTSLDEAALRRALETGHVRGACLDVFTTEPLPHTSWMWDDPRIRVTPHQAAITTARDVADSLARCWRQMRAGEPVTLRVDPDRGY